MEFNIKNVISIAANVLYEVKFHSHTFIWKSLPRFFPCTVKVKGSTKITDFLKLFKHVAQNLRNFAHVSDFKNIASFAFYSVFKVLTF